MILAMEEFLLENQVTILYDTLVTDLVKENGVIRSVTVENTGAMAAKEVVQLYVSDLFCRLTPYVCRLRGFEKILLAPGEKKTVTFTLGFEDFSFLNEALQPEVEPGEFRIRIGDQEAILNMI